MIVLQLPPRSYQSDVVKYPVCRVRRMDLHSSAKYSLSLSIKFHFIGAQMSLIVGWDDLILKIPFRIRSVPLQNELGYLIIT